MNNPDHRAIVCLAFQCFPPWARRTWSALQGEVLSACLLPDQVAIPLLRNQRGPWRRYFPPRLPKFNFLKPQADWRRLLPDTPFYLRKVVACLRAGDLVEAARFAGVYSHYIGDFSQPAHHYELEIGTLLPPPASMRNCEYHRMIEDILSTVKTVRHRGRVLGLSKQEAIFRIAGLYAALFRRSVAAVVPMVRAIYRRRHGPASRALNGVVADSAKLMADFCCTALALATGEAPAGDRRRLAVCDLRDVEPDAYDVEFNFGRKPLVDCITVEEYGRARALAVCRRRGRRTAAERVKGICVIPHALPLETVQPVASLRYRLPAGTFHRFQCEAGLLAGVERQAPSSFEVFVDGRSVCHTAQLRPGDPAMALQADLAGALKLELRVRTDGSTEKLSYAVWANPRLKKADA